MKQTILLFVLLITLTNMATAQTGIVLTVGDQSVTATLVNNDATEALVALLQDGPVTINMNDYGGFEKVGELPRSLPTSNSRITTEPGDIMLYQGDNMVIFYGTNTWSYTRLGKIDPEYLPHLQEFLGTGNITLTISLATTTSIPKISAHDPQGTPVYDLQGHLVTRRPLTPGLYIISSHKTIIH